MKKIWSYLAVGFLFLALGILIGVWVDTDTVYNTDIKRNKQKGNANELIIDVKPSDQGKTKKEIRLEKREDRKEERKARRSNNQ